MASKAPKVVPELFPVIMAGGSGTRFWPLSRRTRPKQFLALATERPMLVETAARLEGLTSLQDTFVVCGQVHAGPAAKLLKKLPKANVLVEPEARNTAPAIALACAHVAARNPQGVVVVLPSDQHVSQTAAFRTAVSEAVAAAKLGRIVTLGIKPTRPETGYGYIRLGGEGVGGARAVGAFVEKPTVEKAQGYLESGEYLWNAGIFIFRVDVMKDAFARYLPEVHGALHKIQEAVGTKKYASVLKREFVRMPSISIDYGIAEKADNIAVVPADCGWSDVGSFNALPEVRAKDERGNVLTGSKTFVIDSDGCVVWGNSRPVAVVGMKDVVVVDTPDAVLVLPKDKSQDVRKVVEALKARKLERHL
jgi:mannose-1-phosphate guanylyltransferase